MNTPSQKQIEEQSWDACLAGDYVTVQDQIYALRAKMIRDYAAAHKAGVEPVAQESEAWAIMTSFLDGKQNPEMKKAISDESMVNIDGLILQEAIQNVLIEPLRDEIKRLQKALDVANRYKQAIELIEKGPVSSVSALEFGGHNITIRLNNMFMSMEYNGTPLVDSIISASKSSMS
jgi:hypothetical protein